MARLSEHFKNEIIDNLKNKFGYKNNYQVPKLEKIVLNMGIGEAKDDQKILIKAQEELTLISGQKAILRPAKKAIAGFKIRAGMNLGVMVTLRNKRMYEFLDSLKIINAPIVKSNLFFNSVALPKELKFIFDANFSAAEAIT